MSDEYGLYLNLLGWRTMDETTTKRRGEPGYYMPPWWVSLAACMFYIALGLLIGVLVAHNAHHSHRHGHDHGHGHHHHGGGGHGSSSSSSSDRSTDSITPAPSPTPFCCDADEFAFVGSPWASAEPTLCGDYDYNCDGLVDAWACCGDAETPFSVGRNVFNVTEPGRCHVPTAVVGDGNGGEICGACAGNEVVVPGWACSEPVPFAGLRKRFVQPCPTSCAAPVPVPVTPGHPPSLGQCALFVDSCVGSNGGDGTSCCQVVAG